MNVELEKLSAERSVYAPMLESVGPRSCVMCVEKVGIAALIPVLRRTLTRRPGTCAVGVTALRGVVHLVIGDLQSRVNCRGLLNVYLWYVRLTVPYCS